MIFKANGAVGHGHRYFSKLPGIGRATVDCEWDAVQVGAVNCLERV